MTDGVDLSTESDDEDILMALEVLEGQLNKHGNLDAAKRFALKTRFPETIVERAVQVLADKRKIFENLEPAPITSQNQRWYYGPPAQSPYWQDYTRRLRAIGWTEPMIDTLDAATSRTMDLLDPPGIPKFATRGLVIGRVQSGKTAHFTGIIGKAADSGYGLFIILSGITNSLRLQTQKRLSRDLANAERPGVWHWLTKQDIFGDFEYQNEANVDLALRGGRHRSIAVVKKQAVVLRKLIDWLKCGNDGLKRDCPVLVIDDEADQASLNTGKQMARDELTKINKLIVELLEVFPRCAYVGYTATPFANVLTHPDYPENLYPRSFMYPLDPPKTYFGSERIHGRQRLTPDEPDEVTDGLPLIRTVPDAEISKLRPKTRDLTGFKFEVTPSLHSALRYFFMATAARLFREAKGSAPMDFSTMLVHTSQRVVVHRQSAAAIRQMVEALRREANLDQLTAWEALWADEMSAIDREKLGVQLGEVEFGDLKTHLFKAIDRCKIIVSNSMKDEETNVAFDEKGQIAIVIGGNTLSRGLTLEGLIVSFFVRSSNAYDTILQMGRWFGYRPYYEDLPRIWMTSEMTKHFRDLATIEEEFRQQLEDYRALGLTPMQAAMRIRRLPTIRITAANKMRFAITAEIGYGRARPQTIHFDSSKKWLEDNVGAASSLVGHLQKPDEVNGGRFVWRGRNVAEILDFLKQYQFHPRSRELDRELLRKYITKQNGMGGLLEWNVVVYGLNELNPELGSLKLSQYVVANCINRSRVVEDKEKQDSTIYIKALMAPMDILADQPKFDAASLTGLTTKSLFAKRGGDQSGVLILYPISKNSKPVRHVEGKPTTRAALGVDVDIIGVAMIFPDGQGHGSNEDYVQANLQPVEAQASIETDDEDELDREIVPAGETRGV